MYTVHSLDESLLIALQRFSSVGMTHAIRLSQLSYHRNENIVCWSFCTHTVFVQFEFARAHSCAFTALFTAHVQY